MATVISALRCDGVEHRIGWHHGRLVLHDHADPLGELALAALGAPWSACISVFSLVRSGFDPVGTWPVWSGPLPRASGPELMHRAWTNLADARRAPVEDNEPHRVQTAEDRWAMAVLGLVDPALRRRLAVDAVVGRSRHHAAGPLNAFSAGSLRRAFSRRDGRSPLAESVLLSSIGAPPGADLLWLLDEAGDRRADRLRR